MSDFKEALVETTTAAAPAVTPDAIFQLATGFMASKMFFTAAEIGLFAQLADGAASADDLAARLKADTTYESTVRLKAETTYEYQKEAG